MCVWNFPDFIELCYKQSTSLSEKKIKRNIYPKKKTKYI